MTDQQPPDEPVIPDESAIPEETGSGDAEARPAAAPAGAGRRRNALSRTPQRLGPPRATGPGAGRLRIIGVIAALLVVGGLIDRAGGPTDAAASAAIPPGPVAAPAGALSSSWFCSGATDNTGGSAPGQLVIANTNAQALTADVTLIPVSGSAARPSTSSVSVGAHTRLDVAENLPGGPAWIGASVTLHGGAASVDQEIDGTLGPSVSPCSTAGSQNWYFPTGRTAINASDVITLLNPFPVDAVVDLSFTTDQGLEAPGEFEALYIPVGSLLSVDLGSHLRRRTAIATTATARTGRVVAWQTRTVTAVPAGTPVLAANGSAPAGAIDPASPVPGVTVSPGAPSGGSSWAWPDGVSGNGIDEQYTIFNPSPGIAQVALSLNLDQGSAEPFTLSVGPEQVATVISDQEARVPAGVTHSAIVRSTNGVPIVATRDVAAGSPSPHVGLGTLLGERQPTPTWLFAGGSVTAHADEELTLFNPGTQAVRASVDSLAGGAPTAIAGLGSVLIPPGGRVAIDLGQHQPSFASAFTVTGSGPLYAERDLLGTSSRYPGYGLGAGVPLRG